LLVGKQNGNKTPQSG